MPAPDVRLVEYTDEILYSGLNLSLQCVVTLSDLSVPYVTVSIEWLKNNNHFTNCAKLISISDSIIHCLLEFTPLSYTRDDGSYSCRAVIHSKPSYPFLRSQTILSNSLNINVAGTKYCITILYSVLCMYYGSHFAVPNVIVAMSTSTNRILDVAPYNQFTGYCNASVNIPGLTDDNVVLLMTHWLWKKREGLGNYSDITDTSFISSNKTTSMLLQTVNVNATNVTYQCVYSLEGVDHISANDTVSVISKSPTHTNIVCNTTILLGKSTPNMPQSVKVFQIFQDSAIIHWTIPSIAYTPETYMIEYGTDKDTLGLFGKAISSGTDIEIVNKVYCVTLKNLKPGTKYYYVVTAQNSAGMNRSVPASFYTKESGKKVVHTLQSCLIYVFSCMHFSPR